MQFSTMAVHLMKEKRQTFIEDSSEGQIMTKMAPFLLEKGFTNVTACRELIRHRRGHSFLMI